MYVAVKGGERAIANAHALLAKQGRGDTHLPRIGHAAVAGQLGVLVSRVMTEGSLYDPELAARAILQAQGDVLEAITLVRSYRTTLPRFGYTVPVRGRAATAATDLGDVQGPARWRAARRHLRLHAPAVRRP